MTLTSNSACTKTQTNFMVSQSLLAWIMDTQGGLSLEGLVQYWQVWYSLEDFVLSHDEDGYYWRHEGSGTFTSRSTYRAFFYSAISFLETSLEIMGSSRMQGFPMSCNSQVLDSRLVSKMGACTSRTVCSLWSRRDRATYSYEMSFR
jgi:hypothetical protein